jgi:hypothetical protein
MMVVAMDQRKVVRGHGAEGRWHKTKLEALEDPTILIDAWWQTFPNLGHTPYVRNMFGGATLTRSGHFLSMKPIGKIIPPNILVA